MKHRGILALSALALMCPLTTLADDHAAEAEADKPNEFTLNAQLLTRGEWRAGGLPVNEAEAETKPEQHALFVMERMRLTAGYTRQALSMKVTAQHSGVWGQSGKGTFNLYEAWAKLQSRQGLFAQIGRQELVYDDQRIIGNNDWAMAAASHDVLRLGYDGDQHRAHLILAYNQNAAGTYGGSRYVNGAEPYKTMQTLWYHYQPKRVPLQVSLMAMNVGTQSAIDDDDATMNQQLVGTYVKANPGKFNLEGSFYYQLGRNEYDLPIHAWMTAMRGDYRFDDRWTAYGGYDYLSGDKNYNVPPAGGFGLQRLTEINGFNLLFGSHHQFYGAMDFFYVTTYYGGLTPGLQNLYVGGKWRPNQKLTLETSYHYMATAVKVTNADKSLGHQVDFTVSYSPLRDVKLAASYTFMAGTPTMEKLKRADGDRFLHWAWISATFTPQFLKVKW